MNLIAVAVMGLLGSLHCAAMCGPLVLLGSGPPGRPYRRAAAGYFLGRLVAYATAGAALGQLGRHALCRIPVHTAQTLALLLLAAVFAWRGVALLRAGAFRSIARPALGATGTASAPLVTLRRHPPGGTSAFLASLVPRRGLALGLATAVLPCGMLVSTWTAAAATGRPTAGAAVMAVFALASSPGLLSALLARPLLARVRPSPTLVGLAWCALAVWLAARPLLLAAHSH